MNSRVRRVILYLVLFTYRERRSNLRYPMDAILLSEPRNGFLAIRGIETRVTKVSSVLHATTSSSRSKKRKNWTRTRYSCNKVSLGYGTDSKFEIYSKDSKEKKSQNNFQSENPIIHANLEVLLLLRPRYIWIKKEEKNVQALPQFRENLFINLPINVRNNDEPRYLLFRFLPSFLPFVNRV